MPPSLRARCPLDRVRASYSCASAFAYKRPCTPPICAFPPLHCMVTCLCALLAVRSVLPYPNDSLTGLIGLDEYSLSGLGNIGTALPRQPTDTVLRFAEKIMIHTLAFRELFGFRSDRIWVSMGFPFAVPGVGAIGCSPALSFFCTIFPFSLFFPQVVISYFWLLACPPCQLPVIGRTL